MEEQNPVNNLNQNIDQLELKHYSPNKIKEPEKINKEGKTVPKRKENNKKSEKLIESKILDDDVEHPDSLLSDLSEGNTEEIKKKFYENKKKENLLVIGVKKNLDSKNTQITQQKLKIEQDSIQLKENIGKVVLNCKFINDKNLKKNNSKSNLLIKPEKVVNNFILEPSSDIKKRSNLKICDINNNNSNSNNKNAMKKNNSLSIIQHQKNKNLIKCNNQNLDKHQMGQIIKIPISLTAKDLKISKQINKIPQPQKLIINKEQKNDNKTIIHQQSCKSCMGKIPLKKITKILPINDITTIENENNKSSQTTIKKINHNYNININENSQSKVMKQNNKNKNSILNKIIISKNSNSSNKGISRNNNNINLSFEKPQNFFKMISPTKLEHSIRRSDEITLHGAQKNKIKAIPIPFKDNKNNNQENMQFYTIQEKTNVSINHTKASNPIKKDLKIDNINKINNSYKESEKENYPNNLKFDNCNKKTIERGGKFNNISTTYVVISKNSRSRSKFPQPSRTIDTQNLPNKNMIPNLSTISLQPFQINPTLPQSFPMKEKKTIKMMKDQNYLINGKKNKSFNFENTNNNYINVNYTTNYNLYGGNDLNIGNTKKNYYAKNKVINRPVIYKYNYGDNLWSDESFFSYLNTSGYNY